LIYSLVVLQSVDDIIVESTETGTNALKEGILTPEMMSRLFQKTRSDIQDRKHWHRIIRVFAVWKCKIHMKSITLTNEWCVVSRCSKGRKTSFE
jgi:hypothetical protein